jgi:uncharacterized protein YjbI with pentapeptide repeats
MERDLERPAGSPPESAEEILRRFARGERFFSLADLPDGSDFHGANLEGCVFRRCWLFDADFRGASLRSANFHESNLKGSDFRDADLRGARFAGSSVEAARFEGARLEGASFAGAGYYGLTLEEGDVPGR